MELKWLEDFLSLAEMRSFSRSAEARNVTQSAFSRRIRSLEVWLGADLIDRGTYPVTLTPDGRAFRETAEEIVRLAHQGRANLGGRKAGLPPTIGIAALHTLSMTFLPRWLNELRGTLGDVASRVLPDNYAICLQALVEGGYDFMLTFHHPSVPVPLDPARFPFLKVGEDRLAAVASAARIEGWRAAGERLPMLQYSKGSFLGLLASVAQSQPGAPDTFIAHINENSMAEAMKFMALEGHGIAWLPRSLAADEIASGRLVVVAPELPMEIRLYRDRERARVLPEKVWQAARNYAASD
ncbi:LysR family transcriptional regulator [Falsirhodobacter sp. 20TX0035]|uniref:LysR family transcriptional regulator n=1 Tax=Falsirhodobacter sp. 20TX0035 TaxID=3022019 RepID=UPI00232B918C|nr:LysR substrate-binding domain-containing protein [Falsirhodobacter sp. 20TX0035]MDB6454056.1 LysR substrate-binding domain-containing protein [Falsirhodobacter sp. 20TX0035]